MAEVNRHRPLCNAVGRTMVFNILLELGRPGFSCEKPGLPLLNDER